MLTSIRHASKGLDLATGTFKPEVVSQLPAGPGMASTALPIPSSSHAAIQPPEFASFPHPAASTTGYHPLFLVPCIDSFPYTFPATEASLASTTTAATSGQGSQAPPVHAPIHLFTIPAHVASTPANVVATTAHVADAPANVVAAPAHVATAAAAANVAAATVNVAASPAHVVAPAYVATTAVNVSAAPVHQTIVELLNVSFLRPYVTVRQANVD